MYLSVHKGFHKLRIWIHLDFDRSTNGIDYIASIYCREINLACILQIQFCEHTLTQGHIQSYEQATRVGETVRCSVSNSKAKMTLVEPDLRKWLISENDWLEKMTDMRKWLTWEDDWPVSVLLTWGRSPWGSRQSAGRRSRAAWAVPSPPSSRRPCPP